MTDPDPTPSWLTIGQLAERSGVATSALRFYEAEGLLEATRTSGNQRRYPRAALRRVAVIRAAQTLGVPLAEVRDVLTTLPDGRTPNKRDWDRLSRNWRRRLDARIDELQRLRNQLTGCIGCGCLSLANCALFNPQDQLAARGPGPRILLGDAPEDASPATT